MDIVQYMWSTREILQELGWTILVLPPKGNTGTQGISLLEMQKVVEDIIDTRLQARIQFQNVLHGFCVGRGTGTEITELNISQDLARVNQDTLFLVLLELRKAYNTVYHGRLISTLEGYGAELHMCKIIATFWVHKEVVIRHNGYHGLNFNTNWGTTQDGLISLYLFKVVVDNVVRTWKEITVNNQTVVQEGLLLNVVRCLVFFDSGDGMVGA